jgi:hypothetical protein
MCATSTFSAPVSMDGPNKDTFRRKVGDVRKDTRDSKRHGALTRPNIGIYQEAVQTTRQACLRLAPSTTAREGLLSRVAWVFQRLDRRVLDSCGE